MATIDLLEEFPPVSTELWEQAIQRDLKGADYAKRLVWQSEEGLAVKPYYRAEDLAGLEYLDAAPDEFPFVRGSRATGEWRIREEIDAAHPEEANHLAQQAVAAGAEEIAFTRAEVRHESDLGLILMNLQEIPVHFEVANELLLHLLVERLKGRERHAVISTGFDPLTGLEFAAEVLKSAPAPLVPFTIHGEQWEESGATAVEEVGFSLAGGVEYLDQMQSRGVDLNRATGALTFSFAIGASYFFQIAKLRAFRLLWARVVESFGGDATSARAHIHARTSRWNKTIYDPYVNALRATTEAMSAAIGGADSISVAPFDECYRQAEPASRRLARNTQILLKQEAHLARVADPAAGSYCLEAMTDFIACEAWKRMQAIEGAGGYRSAKAQDWIGQALQQSLAAREKAVVSRRRVFTGTNQYANPSEKVLDQVDIAKISTASPSRGAECYEQLRLRTERHVANGGAIPLVLLAEFGDAKMRSARSNFAANFFACAGFALKAQRFACAEEIAASEASLIVLCSSDAEYLAMAAGLLAGLREAGRETPVLIAGNPESAEQLKAAGVADFIHIRSNPIEVLSAWQQRLGIGK